ncbi:MAG: hypothetical protein ACT4OY_06335 [Alphaproteobacteria bacterium]
MPDDVIGYYFKLLPYIFGIAFLFRFLARRKIGKDMDYMPILFLNLKAFSLGLAVGIAVEIPLAIATGDEESAYELGRVVLWAVWVWSSAAMLRKAGTRSGYDLGWKAPLAVSVSTMLIFFITAMTIGLVSFSLLGLLY